MRRIGETASRFRLGPSYKASAELETSLRGGAAMGTLRSQAAEQRAHAGMEVGRSTLQSLTELDLLKQTSNIAKARAETERAGARAGAVGSSLGMLGQAAMFSRGLTPATAPLGAEPGTAQPGVQAGEDPGMRYFSDDLWKKRYYQSQAGGLAAA
jgi:hypothetical protein